MSKYGSKTSLLSQGLCFSCGQNMPKQKLSTHQLLCIKKNSSLSSSRAQTIDGLNHRHDRDHLKQAEINQVAGVPKKTIEKICDVKEEQIELIERLTKLSMQSAKTHQAIAKDDDDRVSCQFCNRKFKQDALERHLPICQKVAMKQRKVFDSTRMRWDGTQLDSFKKLKVPSATSTKTSTSNAAVIVTVKGKGKKKTVEKVGNGDWRAAHEGLVTSIKKTKTKKYTSPRGGGLFVEEDLLQCANCLRTFNEQAIERHRPVCASKKQYTKLHPPKQPDPDKMDSLLKRTKFRPPPPKTLVKKK